MPESKRQKSIESDKNVRVNRILAKLLKKRPSQKDMDEWSDSEPEFPTFPTPSLREKAKRQGNNPFLGGGKKSGF